MDLRQELLELARESNPTHLALIDADEVITSNFLASGQMRGWCEQLAPGQVLELPMIAPWRRLDRYRHDRSVWCRSQISVVLRDEPGLSFKDRNGYQHHSRLPVGDNWLRRQPFPEIARVIREGGDVQGGVFHLQWVNWERLVWKHTLYKMTEVLRWPDREPVDRVERKYEQALDESGLHTETTPPHWYGAYDQWLKYVDVDQEPWQKAEALRLLAEHGRERFGGLTLRGVDEPVVEPATPAEVML